MLDRLPVEIQVDILLSNPNSSLKLVNSHFYMLYNDLYYNKIISTFGEDIINVIIKVLPWLKTYIKSLDVFRFTCRNIICSRLNLPYDEEATEDRKGKNLFEHERKKIKLEENLNVAYIKDSWKYIYSLLKNKRLFAEYSDYRIDQPTNYVFQHFVEINRTYLLSYNKSLWLSPGTYNLNVGLVIKHGNGLGTTKFEVKFENDNNEVITQTFYPPTNVNDILPKKQFCLLRLGEFTIPEPSPPPANPSASQEPDIEEEDEEFDELINVPRSNPHLSHLAQRARTSGNDFNFNSNFNNPNFNNFNNQNTHHLHHHHSHSTLNPHQNSNNSQSNLSNLHRNSLQNSTLNGSYMNLNSYSNLNSLGHSRGGSISSIGNSFDFNNSRSNSLPTIISNTSLASLNTTNTVLSSNPINRSLSEEDEEEFNNNNYHPKLVKVELVMEEIGLYLKSGFRIYFIDVAQPTSLFNEFDLLYYSVRETDYRYFINIPLKNFYKALNHVQNGGKFQDTSVEHVGGVYGAGDPYEIQDEYDDEFLSQSLNESDESDINKRQKSISVKGSNNAEDKQLIKYSDFYYNRSFIRRYFKFNTIYQRRQFVNKYGDFEIDWKKGENKNFNAINEIDSYSHSDLTNLTVGPDENRACSYDLYGLKWKMLPLGQL